ncbi:MAG TPA: hypothetical protein VG759_13015 [Candidatus Angelobacter sp.]|jgi:hypothetical protein|nr:hypothetical protein [Candidatus Angelobacter sp.]
MTLKVELNAKVEAGLMAQAEARGLSLEAYVSRLLEERSSQLVRGKRHPSGMSVVELFEPLKGLEVEFERNHSTGRAIDL